MSVTSQHISYVTPISRLCTDGYDALELTAPRLRVRRNLRALARTFAASMQQQRQQQRRMRQQAQRAQQQTRRISQQQTFRYPRNTKIN